MQDDVNVGYDGAADDGSSAVDPDPWNEELESIYNELLGRGSDESGYQSYIGMVKGGQSGQVRDAIKGSAEYRGRQSPQSAVSTSIQAAAPSTTRMPTFDSGGGNGALDDYLAQLMAMQSAEAAERSAARAQQREFSDRIRGSIMDRFNKASEPVNESDPYISRQRQVYSADSQRALGRAKEAFAARGSAQGTPEGASDAFLQSSIEKQGQDESRYSAGLIADEYNKRRAEINNLLQLGAGVLSNDENRMLQEEMGIIDANLRNLGMKNNFQLGSASLSNQRLGIDNQNTQFYDRMGYDIGLQEALMNQAILSQLMGA